MYTGGVDGVAGVLDGAVRAGCGTADAQCMWHCILGLLHPSNPYMLAVCEQSINVEECAYSCRSYKKFATDRLGDRGRCFCGTAVKSVNDVAAEQADNSTVLTLETLKIPSKCKDQGIPREELCVYGAPTSNAEIAMHH